jgi:hypothetical protein
MSPKRRKFITSDCPFGFIFFFKQILAGIIRTPMNVTIAHVNGVSVNCMIICRRNVHRGSAKQGEKKEVTSNVKHCWESNPIGNQTRPKPVA